MLCTARTRTIRHCVALVVLSFTFCNVNRIWSADAVSVAPAKAIAAARQSGGGRESAGGHPVREVEFPEDKPCINEYGERVQAFAGCGEGGWW